MSTGISLLGTKPEEIGAALGRITSGCFILTTSHADRATGVLVSWVQQASFDPPIVTVCLKHGRPVVDVVEASERFLINVLAEDASALFGHFGKGFGPQEDAFAGLTTEPTEFGPLLNSCIAHLGCRVIGKTEAGDHILYLGEVLSASGDDQAKPYIHTRRSGLGY